MPRITIDNQEVEIPEGATLLDAARKLGIDVPALCHFDGIRPMTSCMVCVMKDLASGRLVPSCATVATDGMRVASETEEVHAERKSTLELLLSDHAGECHAPCHYSCVFDSDVPQILRHIAKDQLAEAAALLRREVPLAAAVTRAAPDSSEVGCRRGAIDESVAIGLLKQHVADRDLASSAPALPACEPATNRKVAIIGAGPAGLSAAYFLQLRGHACTVFERSHALGGSLAQIDAQQLPPEVLQAEIALLERMGITLKPDCTLGEDVEMEQLHNEYDAVILAIGKLPNDAATDKIIPVKDGHIQTDAKSHQTPLDKVFAAGDAPRDRRSPARAAADGKAAAVCVDQFLRGEAITGPSRLTSLKLGRPTQDELTSLATAADGSPRVSTPADAGNALAEDDARREAARCLHCDCADIANCRLKKYAEMYGADGSRYRGERRDFKPPVRHENIIYEPGKCILCGLCVRITESVSGELGLTFVGRGFDVHIGVPFDKSIGEALRQTAARCAEACPTGALRLPD